MYDAAVAAFLGNGHADTTFGVNGIATFNVGDSDLAPRLAVDAGGRFVVSVWNGSDPNKGDFAVGRLLPSGTLDFSFGGTGVVTTTINVNARAEGGVVTTADGIVVAGQSWSADSNTMKTTLVRYVQ